MRTAHQSPPTSGSRQSATHLRACAAVGISVVLLLAGATGARAGAAPQQEPAATGGSGATGVSTSVASTGGSYVALSPVRILDTRSGLGGHFRVAPLQSIDLQVAGRAGVPATGVSAIVVQVTSTGQSSSGYVTVFPSLTARPSVSNLNFTSGADTSNLVTVPLGANGRIELFNGSGGTNQLVADVQGYFRSGTPGGADSFVPLTPSRILDTRSNDGASAPAALGTVSVQVDGRGGVPLSGVGAVAVNVTATQPIAGGYATVYAAGSARPNASDVNFRAGQTVPNLVIVPVGADGKINLFNGSLGRAQMIADVQGYFLAGVTTTSGTFSALRPARILDTRSGLGGSHRSAAWTETKVHVEGFGGVPASGVSAVVVNLTGVASSRPGSVVAYPTGVVMPLASNINFAAGDVKANLAIVPVDSFGWISLTNNSAGGIDEIADVQGYFLGTGVSPTVLGPDRYGPFTMGMTAAQATAVYPALDPTFVSPTSCGNAVLPHVLMVFNHGSTALDYIATFAGVGTANGIVEGDTFASVVHRFSWAEIFPNDPPMVLAVTKPDPNKPVEDDYVFHTDGPLDPGTDLPLLSDKITTISLDHGQNCFD